jgi:hypothetical protein
MDRSLTPILRELANWPGVDHEIRHGGKHPRIVLTHRGASRFVTFSGTPSDRRGVLNKISDVRTTLRALGAAPKVQTSKRGDRK